MLRVKYLVNILIIIIIIFSIISNLSFHFLFSILYLLFVNLLILLHLITIIFNGVMFGQIIHCSLMEDIICYLHMHQTMEGHYME